MALGDFLLGTPATSQQFPSISPQQQGLKSAVNKQALNLLQGVGGSFTPIAQQARTQFQTQTIPSLAERFTSLGGGQRSSAFQGALGQAGAGLEESLAGLQSQHGLQLLQMLLGSSLTPEVETGIQPQSQGLLGTLLPLLLQIAPTTLGSLFGGPLGAVAGGGLGSALTNLLGGR